MIQQQTTTRTETAYAIAKGVLDIVQADLEVAILTGDRAEVTRCRQERTQLWDELDRLEKALAEEGEYLSSASGFGRDSTEYLYEYGR